MMTRVLLTFLVGLVVSLGVLGSLGPNAAFAETFDCKRHTQAHSSFKTQSDFELWFPKEISLEIYDWKSREGYKSLTKVQKEVKYILLPNGNLIARLEKYSDSLGKALDYQKPKVYFREVTHIKYECNLTSLQLVAGLKNKQEEESKVKITENSDNTSKPPNQEDDPFAKAKNTCSELGFTTGTEKHGDCVLEQQAIERLKLYAEQERRLLASIRNMELDGVDLEAMTDIATPDGQEQQQQDTISNDTQIPLITITQSGADGRKGSVKGYAKDNVQVAEVLIDGQAVRVGNDGSFEWSGFVPATGKEITIEAIDTAALSSTKTVSLKRGQIQQASGPRFDVLDPTAGKKVKRNDNALALIVGISDYKRTDAPAVYADKDAQYFHDYASLKLGISDSNIKTMVNAKAEQGDVILAVKDWIRRSSKPGKTDVYVFFAGHGLASDDGEQMYLLPYDGRPRLLDDTAIARERLFSDIASANPRSVTVFLDTCYSGTTRGTDMLIASRPIAIKALEQSIPENFTVMTAAAGDQTAKPLEEAKHGMFSYFLMKGMEGDADANNDNQITAGELHSYVQQNVVQQSSGSQTPELQGDAERVLVRFQ